MKFFRNPSLINNDFPQKNYYSQNNNLDAYISKINELNLLLSNEINKNQVRLFLLMTKIRK